MPEQPPEDDENQYRAEAPAAQLLGAVTRGEAAEQLAHGSPSRSVGPDPVHGAYRAVGGSEPESFPRFLQEGRTPPQRRPFLRTQLGLERALGAATADH